MNSIMELTATPHHTPVLSPEPIWFIDSVARIHIDGAQSTGALDLVEMTMPAGDMPPLHVHLHDDETFFVLAGELSLYAGDQHSVLTAGQALLVPRGVPHAYRAETDVRALVLGTPAGFAAFVRAVGTPAEHDGLPPAGRPLDPAALACTEVEHGIQILGPPGMLPAELG